MKAVLVICYLIHGIGAIISMFLDFNLWQVTSLIWATWYFLAVIKDQS